MRDSPNHAFSAWLPVLVSGVDRLLSAVCARELELVSAAHTLCHTTRLRMTPDLRAMFFRASFSYG